MPPLKKFFIFSSLILALILFFWGVYNLAFRSSQEESLSSPLPSLTTALEKEHSISKKIELFTDESTLNPVLNQAGSAIRYYSQKDRGFYEISLGSKIKDPIFKKEFPGLESISWSPNKDRAIIKIKPTAHTWYFVFLDFMTQKEVALNDNVDNIFWQNDNKILYQYFDPATKKRTLDLSDPDGNNWKKLTDLNFSSFFAASIPQSGLISFWNNPDAYTESVLQSISPISNESKVILKDKFGADFLWSPNGKRLLVSHSQDKGGRKIQLAITNNNGGEYKNLEFPTLATKCAWSKDNETVFCALPAFTRENMILPNDYFSQPSSTADTFWKINTSTGEKKRLVELEKIDQKMDAANLFLTPDESLLFLVNKIDQKLYQISL